MNIDLNELSKEELLVLRKDVEKALETLDMRRRAEALRAAEVTVSEYGFSLKELRESAPTKTKGVPKYRNPENPAQTWTGKGRKPKWLTAALKSGKSLDDLEI